MMWRLAIGSIRAHLGSYCAAAAVMTAGTALLTGFASLLETGLATGDDSGFLVMLPVILGGWTAAVVTFGVTSTVALAIQSREREIALLRSIAATPGQIKQSIVLETVVTAVPSVAAGLLPGVAIGAFVLGRLVDAGLVDAATELRPAWLCVTIGAATTLLAAFAAALIAGRRAASTAPVRALADSAPTVSSPLTRGRTVAGVASVLVGLSLTVATLFMDDGPLLSSTAGPAGVAVAIGLSLLAPAAVASVGRLSDIRLGATSRLAIRNIHARARHAATVAAPLILLVGIATGTLYMQSTEDAAQRDPAVADAVSVQLAPVNYLVVIMIIGFSSIVVINTLVAATRRRQREFGLLRLSAATGGQVLRMVTIEAVITTIVAVTLGTVAAAATAVPYSLVKIGSPIASGSPWMYVAIVAGAFLLAASATTPTAMSTLRTRPVDALTAT